MYHLFTLRWLKGRLSGEWHTEKILSPDCFSSGKVRPKRTPLLLSAVSRTARILNVSRWALSPTVGAIKPAIFPFQLSLINYSSAATSAFPPQQGTDTTICPRELGLCRICQFCLDCLSELWITQEPVQGTKVSTLLWEHSTWQLLKYSAHLHTTPEFTGASRIPEQRKVFKCHSDISI